MLMWRTLSSANIVACLKSLVSKTEEPAEPDASKGENAPSTAAQR